MHVVFVLALVTADLSSMPAAPATPSVHRTGVAAYQEPPVPASGSMSVIVTTPQGVVVSPVPGQQTPARAGRPDEPAKGTASIRGQVMGADTNSPLRRAQVRVMGPMNAGGMAQTDAQGRYEIAQLPAGRYTVSVSKSGYVGQAFGQRRPNQPGTPIELADGQLAEKVNFALARGGAVTGKIVDEFGEPVSGAQVTLQRYGFFGGGRRLMMAGSDGGSDRTDDLGQFRLFGLPPGEYYLSAILRTMEMFAPSVQMSSTTSDGYAPTYFPGTPNLAEAQRVIVKAAQEVQNVSFALSPARVARIRGRVVTSQGEPYAEGMLMVAPQDPNLPMGGLMGGAPIRSDGSFQTQPMPPGSYTISVQPQGRPFGGGGTDGEMARLDVRVDGEDVDNVNIVTGRGGIIRGRIVSDAGTTPPIKPAQVRIFPSRDESANRPFMGTPPASAKDDWTFEVQGLLDRVRLRAMVEAPGWTLKSALKEGVDIADAFLDVGPGRVVEDVEIVLTEKITELTGAVRNDRGQPATDVTVIVFPENRAEWTTGSRYLRVANPDTEGKYKIRLTPSEGLLIVALPRLEDGGSFADPELLARAVEVATPLSMGEGQTKTMDLKVVQLK